jgi:predicted RNase H-like nuclease (RuvC/YqgF family)
MLYLAQVQKKGLSGQAELLLLACQQSAKKWTRLRDTEVLFTPETQVLREGMLVLVDVTETHQVTSVRDARDWVLQLLEQAMLEKSESELLQREQEQIEQWHHALTLQSQDLGCRALELEARREQIQVLEEHLKRERRRLQDLANELNFDSQRWTIDLDPSVPADGDRANR